MIAALLLGYVACAVAAGYVCGLICVDSIDRTFLTGLAVLGGPLGLTVALGFLAAASATRRRERLEAEHRANLAALASVEREMAKLEGR